MANADRNAAGPGGQPVSPPINPYLVLLAAILLPGFGQVLCGETRRGFTLQMFMIVLAIVTWHLAPPGASLVGKLAGGVFIYAISVVDAYSIARRRWSAFHEVQNESEARRGD
jgi:hypothetical protein